MSLRKGSIHALWELRVSGLYLGSCQGAGFSLTQQQASAPAHSELVLRPIAGDVSECVLRCGVRLDLRQALHGIVSSISSQPWDLSQPPMQAVQVKSSSHSLLHTPDHQPELQRHRSEGDSSAACG